MSQRHTYEFIKSEFEKEGYQLLSEEYINGKHPLEYICPKGHINKVTWSKWNKKRNICPDCNKKHHYSINEIRDLFEKEKYTLITNVYKHCESKLSYICPEGHELDTTWSVWRSGYRCPICNGKDRYTTERVREIVGNLGYTLESSYNKYHSNLELICPNNHVYYVSLANWLSKEYRCTKCNLTGRRRSLAETEIMEFLNNNNVYFESGDRYLLRPKEVDILLPEKRIAIEYCGLYWHSETSGKDKNYHLDKLERCEKEDYRLITIFEDEFNYNKGMVFSRLKNIIGIDDHIEKIYGRHLQIKEIDTLTASRFFKENHMQGYTGSKIKLGAFHKNILVSAMTFSTPSIAKGYIDKKENVWELSRFCSSKDYRVIGGASKLLSYFKRTYDWYILFSYADRRWSIGNLYEKLGFSFDKYTSPNYWYIKQDKRIHRFTLRKKQEEPKDITEWELRKAQGWNRIWDCGNLKYVMYNK